MGTGRGRLTAFLRDESGVVAPLMLIFFFLMLLVGGIAVDLMRFETKRVALQQTMDRATIAAAALENDVDPEDVVRSYMETSGVDGTLVGVDVVAAINSRTVTAEASVRSKNYFMSIMDDPYLDAMNISVAEQRIDNVEISLVLDISGSMKDNSKITNLKSAASEFIDTVLRYDTQNKISISIVPYNGQVNLGPQLISKYNVSYARGASAQPTTSYCLDLPPTTYSSTALSRTTPLPQVPFVDHWTSVTRNTTYYAPQTPNLENGLYTNMWCQPNAATYVSAFGNDATKLKAQINGLIAVGATSIDLGLKWGAALLDPASRSVITELATANHVPNYFSGRPGDYGDRETLKVIVLMTDGSNFEQERTGDAYRTGQTDIWKGNSDSNFSILHSYRLASKDSTERCKPFYVPHLNAWHARPWNGSTPGNSLCYSASASISGATRQTWQQVWAAARSDWVAWHLYARAIGGTNSTNRSNAYTTWKENFRGYTDIDDMDSRLNTVCSSAKAQGVLIYGIAFEAPDEGATAIRNCANSPESTYYFDAHGLEIRTAFRMIASNLSQLRLTQ